MSRNGYFTSKEKRQVRQIVEEVLADREGERVRSAGWLEYALHLMSEQTDEERTASEVERMFCANDVLISKGIAPAHRRELLRGVFPALQQQIDQAVAVPSGTAAEALHPIDGQGDPARGGT